MDFGPISGRRVKGNCQTCRKCVSCRDAELLRRISKDVLYDLAGCLVLPKRFFFSSSADCELVSKVLTLAGLRIPATGMMSSVAQPRAMSVTSSVRPQQTCLLKPLMTSGRFAFRRQAPLRHQPIVRAEQKQNGKDSKADKDVEKLVKGTKHSLFYLNWHLSGTCAWMAMTDRRAVG